MMAEALARWMQDEGIGTYGTEVFASHAPDEPDNIIVCRDESASDLPGSSGLRLDHVGVHVLIRRSGATGFDEGRSISWQIRRSLLGFSGFLNTAFPRVITVNPAGVPVDLPRDRNSRVSWSSHYRIMIESDGTDLFRFD